MKDDSEASIRKWSTRAPRESALKRVPDDKTHQMLGRDTRRDNGMIVEEVTSRVGIKDHGVGAVGNRGNGMTRPASFVDPLTTGLVTVLTELENRKAKVASGKDKAVRKVLPVAPRATRPEAKDLLIDHSKVRESNRC